jgi:hypothetical protein
VIDWQPQTLTLVITLVVMTVSQLVMTVSPWVMVLATSQ